MPRFSMTSNAAELAARWQARAQSVPRELRKAAWEHGKVITEQAKEFSSLTDHTLRQLATYYKRKPRGAYSRRRPADRPHPDFQIHKQSGAFYGAWGFGVTVAGGRFVATVRNRARHARYMRGTRRMRERPVLKEAVRRTAPKRSLITRKAMRAALEVK
jgi:hypothetical protein